MSDIIGSAISFGVWIAAFILTLGVIFALVCGALITLAALFNWLF